MCLGGVCICIYTYVLGCVLFCMLVHVCVCLGGCAHMGLGVCMHISAHAGMWGVRSRRGTRGHGCWAQSHVTHMFMETPLLAFLHHPGPVDGLVPSWL